MQNHFTTQGNPKACFVFIKYIFKIKTGKIRTMESEYGTITHGEIPIRKK